MAGQHPSSPDRASPVAIVVAENGDAGGIGRYCVDLATEMGPDVVVACLCHRPCAGRDGCWLAVRCADRAIPLHRVPMPAKGWRSGLRGLVRLWRRSGRPLIHVNGRRGNAIAATARLGVPGFRYVTTVHGMLGLHARRNVVYRIVDLAAGRLASAVIAVSEHGRVALLRSGSPAARTTTVLNGLTTSDLSTLLAVATSRRRPLGDASIRVGFLGRLSLEKGTREFVDLIGALATASPSIRFDIAGDGPERQRMVEDLRTLTAAGMVHWRGVVADPAAFLGDIDILVMPSHNEGLPYALLEAMAAGCAVVAFDVGGIPEVIDGPEVGVVVPAGDVTAMAAAVTALALDPARLASIGEAAADRVERHFALRARLPALARLYGRESS